MHRVLWKSGYRIVGNPNEGEPPAFADDSEYSEEHSEADAPPASAEDDAEPEEGPPAEQEGGTPAGGESEEELSEEEIKTLAWRDAYEAVLMELGSLHDSYKGAAERQKAIAGDRAGSSGRKATMKIEATVEILQSLIDRAKSEWLEIVD